ncbi:MAG: TetR/AcrR family transcriptional regulator [Pseudoflavonifractor sp.]|nr:TetR/AcrR family transcriptional regulator [Alloprevotella sp.]MCM1116264.1 TetR/AcrR family transcriptional regulator [Pseudoflavonifractor sp.]
MVSKTRERLIEVARQLFVHKGIENTTMNDIAAASEKGRRTIYTYFKNKREIYNAVIERESEQLVQRMRVIRDRDDIDTVAKFEMYLQVRFDFLAEAMPRHDGILQWLGRDIRRVDRIRRLALEKELGLFKSLLDEGVEEGVFDSAQAGRLPSLERLLFQGMWNVGVGVDHDEESPVLSGQLRDDTIRFILNGIVARRPSPASESTTAAL